MSGKARGATQARVYEAVRQMAMHYELRPGETVNEAALAAQLGVSRTPLREALHRLVTERLMRFVPNKGFYCRTLSPEEVCQLFEVREALEVRGFKLACARASDQEIARFAAQAEAFARAAPALSARERALGDEAFHEDLVALSGNPELLAALKAVNARIRFVREIENQRPGRAPDLKDEHAAIVKALKGRKAGKGGRILSRHLTMTLEDALAVIKEAIARSSLARPA